MEGWKERKDGGILVFQSSSLPTLQSSNSPEDRKHKFDNETRLTIDEDNMLVDLKNRAEEMQTRLLELGGYL